MLPDHIEKKIQLALQQKSSAHKEFERYCEFYHAINSLLTYTHAAQVGPSLVEGV